MNSRCTWCLSDPLLMEYHDNEWGVAIYNDQKLFELLILEGAQAGLSWLTILKRRENYRKAFDNFDAEKIAVYKEEKITELMNNPGIIRNKLKILSTIKNAKSFLLIQKELGSFSKYIWQFTNGVTQYNKWNNQSEYPKYSEAARNMSKNLKKRGFNFVGPSICYSFMQACGMVNDHVIECIKHKNS